MQDPLDIRNEMRQFDRKNRSFYDDLDEDQKKKLSIFPLIRWGSAVEGNRDLQEFYVIATNERFNRRFFNVNAARHRKLLWLTATTVSPDLGDHYHPWIKPKSRKTNKRIKELSEIFPHAKQDELELLAELNTDADIRQYRKHSGD